jgi:hypothetical protein
LLGKTVEQKSRSYQTNAEFHADFGFVEKVFKKCIKKVISETSLTNMSKSEKIAYFCHVFANNFLHFFKLVQRFRNQRTLLWIPFCDESWKVSRRRETF